MKGFVVAGERSGVGKTLLTMALAAAFRRRGLQVQCFKVGPDFIDPGYHGTVTGRISRNLDGWMMGERSCRRCFQKHLSGSDMAIVEGVMGLFDGCDGRSEDGSTAQIAKWLQLPVLLVVDGAALGRTAGAVVLGFEHYDPQVTFAGVLFNNVASRRHYELLRDGLSRRCSLNVLGYIPRTPEWQIPARHLGLTMAHEQANLRQLIRQLSRRIQETVDLDKIMACRPKGRVRASAADDIRPAGNKGRKKIGIARDEAFCFYYQDNIDALEACGARMVPFSPLHDRHLPTGLNALYLGGGYPELFAAQLQKNTTMRREILDFCRGGYPVYAECGGFIYLLQAVTDQQHKRYDMVGLFPAEAVMRRRLQRFGYVEVAAAGTCGFLAEGDRARGHEFHYSDITEMPREIERCYRVYRRKGDEPCGEGYRVHGVLASYIHLHFASCPGFAKKFVAMARHT